MAEYRPLGAPRSRAHLPVLLPSRYRVCESAGDGAGARTEALLSRRKRFLGLSKAWKQFKLSSASCFSFVESAGLLYVLKLVTDSLGWTRPVPHPGTAGLGRLDTAALGPDLDAVPPAGGEQDGSWGIPRDERADVAAFILNAMGLKSRFAPIVLLAGHGSSTVNNPQRAGLDCGACAGQTGAASVRMAAAILNDPAVRATLTERGQPIPDDTWFVPALHDTTTDEVHLLETASLPANLRPALDRLRSALDRAGDIARLERVQFLDKQLRADADNDPLIASLRRDISQVESEITRMRNAGIGDQHRIGVAHIEQIQARVVHLVLHGELDVNNGFVLGEHQRFARHGHSGLSAAARPVADFDETPLFDVDNLDLLDRIGNMPVGTGHGRFGEGPEAQHHAAFTGVDNIDAGKQPHHQHDDRHQAESRKSRPADSATTTSSAAAALAAAEQSAELVLHLAHDFVQIRWPLVATTAPGIFVVSASRLIPGHA